MLCSFTGVLSANERNFLVYLLKLHSLSRRLREHQSMILYNTAIGHWVIL